MVDASQVISYKRFVDSLSDRTRLFSSENSDSICIYANQKNILKVEIEQGMQNQKKPDSVGFYALYGMITLKRLSYLMLVTKANLAGQILQRKILQVEEIKFLPLGPNAKLNDIHDDDRVFVEMITKIVRTKTIYFSHEYDLTNCFDKGMANASQFTNQEHTADKLNYYKIANERFAYNWPHISFLSQFKNNLSTMQYWQSVFISGCVLINYCRLTQSSDCFFILISRREILRSGKRFVQRGCDDDGNCTNFAETEQLIILDKKDSFAVYSYVQTRGSMPFSWKQPPTLKWSPKAVIQGDRNYNQELCKKHFDQQMRVYPNQVLVNLIDKKGTQKMLGEYYTALVSGLKNQKIKYIWFDFHHECKKMKYENLSKLLNEMKDELKKDGYFHCELLKSNVNQLTQVFNQQKGVVRTNCMDCLDRTNVVQGVVGRYILLQILHECNIINELTGEAFQVLPNDLEGNFRDQWTRNADIMSSLYSGTGALKTDFTRTGKRTILGALNDGRNSLQRYYINNFKDGYNQNCVDLMLGKLKADVAIIKTPKLSSGVSLLLIIMFILYLSMTFAPKILFSPDSEYQNSNITSALIFMVSFFLITKILNKTYKIFIQKPLLEQ